MGWFSGFAVTLRQIRKGKVTERFPFEKAPKPVRAHGRHVLNRYEDGMEKCIGCELCAGVCPARCIFVRGADNPPESPVSPGERYGFVYEINYLRCILCGLCIEACPTGATLFGKKRELLEIARARVTAEPDKYVQHIYGEHEVGGTGWLYLFGAAPEKLGLRTNLGTTPYPELTAGFLYGVPLVFVLWPSLLIGLNYLIKDSKVEETKEAPHGEQR